MSDKPSGDFSIGSTVWPGISRLVEEAGELQQVCGKLIGSHGEVEHWDGTNLGDRLADELADVSAAIDFVVDHNGLDLGAFAHRKMQKYARYLEWHADPQPAPGTATHPEVTAAQHAVMRDAAENLVANSPARPASPDGGE